MTKGTCPVCNGVKRMPCPDNLRQYGLKNGWYGYDKADDTVDCNNCGTQYMFGQATGQVKLRPDGTPCKHEYEGATIGRCLNRYVCVHCRDSYDVDSSD